MRNICTECKEPIMIVSGVMVSPLESTDVIQVTSYGCLNAKCGQHGIIVDKTEEAIVQE